MSRRTAPAAAVQSTVAIATALIQPCRYARSFYVAKAGRGRGVGGLLMETALAFARQAGYVALSLYVFRALSAAVQVYLRHGFFIAAQCVWLALPAPRASACRPVAHARAMHCTTTRYIMLAHAR
jgi:GNAT superfamily N-acetyltransferase